jgi:hypothetical protein
MAPWKTATPPELLLAHLRAARQRGESFADAWSLALDSAVYGVRVGEPPGPRPYSVGKPRREWREILIEQMPVWRRCYEGTERTRADIAISGLRDFCDPGHTLDRCPNGHAWTRDNTYTRPGGGRHCRRCGADAAARKRERKKAAA